MFIGELTAALPNRKLTRPNHRNIMFRIQPNFCNIYLNFPLALILRLTLRAKRGTKLRTPLRIHGLSRIKSRLVRIFKATSKILLKVHRFRIGLIQIETLILEILVVDLIVRIQRRQLLLNPLLPRLLPLLFPLRLHRLNNDFLRFPRLPSFFNFLFHSDFRRLIQPLWNPPAVPFTLSFEQRFQIFPLLIFHYIKYFLWLFFQLSFSSIRMNYIAL